MKCSECEKLTKLTYKEADGDLKIMDICVAVCPQRQVPFPKGEVPPLWCPRVPRQAEKERIVPSMTCGDCAFESHGKCHRFPVGKEIILGDWCGEYREKENVYSYHTS